MCGIIGVLNFNGQNINPKISILKGLLNLLKKTNN